MRKYLIIFVALVIIIGGSIYITFSRHDALTVTYIKFDSTPSFIIGVNSKDIVVSYNPLNEEAKDFNLLMFYEKTIEEASKIFYSKCHELQCLNDASVNLTIITKNDRRSNDLYQKITDVIRKENAEIVINLLEPTSNDLLAYSNETVYNVSPTFQNSDLLTISLDLTSRIDSYVQNKLNSLNYSKMSLIEQQQLIEEKISESYFNDFNLTTQAINDYNISISNRSNYEILFSYDNEVSYQIVLNMEFDYDSTKTVNDKETVIVEVYKYKYSNNAITNSTNNYYSFTY